MVENDQSIGQPEEPRGRFYLRKLDMEFIADVTVTRQDGTELKLEDFPATCGPMAVNAFENFVAMSPDSPEFLPSKQALQALLGSHAGIDLSAYQEHNNE